MAHGVDDKHVFHRGEDRSLLGVEHVHDDVEEVQGEPREKMSHSYQNQHAVSLDALFFQPPLPGVVSHGDHRSSCQISEIEFEDISPVISWHLKCTCISTCRLRCSKLSR